MWLESAYGQVISHQIKFPQILCLALAYLFSPTPTSFLLLLPRLAHKMPSGATLRNVPQYLSDMVRAQVSPLPRATEDRQQTAMMGTKRLVLTRIF